MVMMEVGSFWRERAGNSISSSINRWTGMVDDNDEWSHKENDS